MRSWPSIITNRAKSKKDETLTPHCTNVAMQCAMCIHLNIYNTDCRASLHLLLQMEGDYDTKLCLGREAGLGHGRCTRQQSHQCECGKTFQVESNFFHSITCYSLGQISNSTALTRSVTRTVSSNSSDAETAKTGQGSSLN